MNDILGAIENNVIENYYLFQAIKDKSKDIEKSETLNDMILNILCD